MARSDDNLPGLGKKELIPRLPAGVSVAQLKLSESEGYVLSRVDARTTLWEICLLVPLRRDDTLRILRRLRRTGIIEIPGSTEPMPAAEPEPRTLTSPRLAAIPSAAGAGQAQTSARVDARPHAPPPDPGVSPTSGRPAPAARPSGNTRPPAAPPPAPEPRPVAQSRLSEPRPQRGPEQRPSPPLDLSSSLLAYIQSIPELDGPEGQAQKPLTRADASPSPADREPATPDPRSLPLHVLEPSEESPDLSNLSLFRPAAVPQGVDDVEVIRSTPASRLREDLRGSQRSGHSSPSHSSSQRPPSPQGQGQGQGQRSTGSRPPASPNGPNGQRSTGSRPRSGPIAASPASGRIPPPPEDLNPFSLAGGSSVPAQAQAEAESPCELSPEQQRRIDGAYAQLGVADAFALLGVSHEADKKDIQRAYFRLSKDFHPDRFFQKQLGPYRHRITMIFQALTEAREILVDDDRRRAYLQGTPT